MPKTLLVTRRWNDEARKLLGDAEELLQDMLADYHVTQQQLDAADELLSRLQMFNSTNEEDN